VALLNELTAQFFLMAYDDSIRYNL